MLKLNAADLATIIDALDTHGDKLWAINAGGEIDSRWYPCKQLRDRLALALETLDVPTEVQA